MKPWKIVLFFVSTVVNVTFFVDPIICSKNDVDEPFNRTNVNETKDVDYSLIEDEILLDETTKTPIDEPVLFARKYLEMLADKLKSASSEQDDLSIMSEQSAGVIRNMSDIVKLGSAILHLFPQAFDIVDDKYRVYFWNTSFIFAGIYIFYCIEMCLKIFKTYYTKNRRKRVPSLAMIRDEDLFRDRMHAPSPASSNIFLSDCRGGSLYQIKYATSSDDSSSSDESMNGDIRDSIRRNRSLNSVHDDEIISLHSLRDVKPHAETIDKQQIVVGEHMLHHESLEPGNSNSNNRGTLFSTREQLAQCLSSVNVMAPPPPPSTYSAMLLQQRKTVTTGPIHRPFNERMVPNVALRRQDHETSNIIVIDTVAWMIVLGDALLNFIDGLSIGAAFDRNILAGMSISVAVMLEEVTHRLGTFAVLIRAGMSMKQSFLYIFLSACACFPGLALGIFLGDEAEDASPYIFALAGGFFLYMALVDVMKAMTRTIDNASRKNIRTLLQIWALQNLGIILAAISLALLAYYEREMDFERREMAEIRGNSFI
ncbi:hypothetical protein RDWZM_007511 [Blomia tropicalis]|uniref:Uncharacterized protein n=1 Tax=Blomia tropicalis TaxID=40697 RepID=A0A9Q0RJ37_BLOTA|nr:hypothetical protein RDWZM_007511 [Blomia tropicalis]